MSHRIPDWKLNYGTQEQEGIHLSSHSDSRQQNPTYVLPMSNDEVAELTWEKGQISMHSLGSKKANTLESMVHHATCYTQNPNPAQNSPNMKNVFLSSSGKPEKSDNSLGRKRLRSEPGQHETNFSRGARGESLGPNVGAGVDACASASIGTPAMTWPSFESTQSIYTKTFEEDYGSVVDQTENQDVEGQNRDETVRSNPTRRNRSASVHNLSERRRRDRINQKMKALQKLVPNSNKADKASMLDEAIEYLKKLQAQVQMMNIRNIPQMMMPLAFQQQQQQQQQLQMSDLIARMGLGMDMGPVLTHPPAVSAPVLVPQMIPPPSQPIIPFNHPYSAFLAQQPMNVDIYNKMAAAYLQQVNQAATGSSQSNPIKKE